MTFGLLSDDFLDDFPDDFWFTFWMTFRMILGDFLDDSDDGFCSHRHVKMELSITVFDLSGSGGPAMATLGDFRMTFG